MWIFLQVDDTRGDEDSQPTSHLTESHTPAPDDGGEDLAGVLQADEEGGGDVESPQQARHQPQWGEILGLVRNDLFWIFWYIYLTDQSIAQTEDRGEEKESDERTPPACLVDDDRNNPAGHLHQGPAWTKHLKSTWIWKWTKCF